ncbi:hypothetical protein CKF54_06630 [Psittacicella hinzii]|uniref:Transposase IS4-like domain-containing protein n=1 Tax=Psittacicella hinzii TaxID=2028575 RepID=A0A3A1Y1L9_9GAMM|nr:hypothetical protein CKF54_06630 [Psittacicella hinzii]
MERGYNRDKDNLPQMNFALIIDEVTGIPINFDLYHGSTTDVTHFRSRFNELLPDSSENEISIICDTGCVSTDIIEDLNSQGLGVTTLLRESTNAFKECVEKTYDIIEKQGDYLFDEDVYTMQVPVMCGDTPMTANVFFSTDLYREEFRIERSKVEKVMEEAKNNTISFAKQIKKHDGVVDVVPMNDGDVQIYKAVFSNEKFKENTKHCGIFVVIDNNGKDAKECLLDYRRRNFIELMMRIIKHIFGCRVYRTHTKETSLGKALSIFISLIIYNELSNRIKGRSATKKLTILDAITELNKIRVYKLKNGSVGISPITGKQKEILKAVGLSEEQFIKRIERHL